MHFVICKDTEDSITKCYMMNTDVPDTLDQIRIGKMQTDSLMLSILENNFSVMLAHFPGRASTKLRG